MPNEENKTTLSRRNFLWGITSMASLASFGFSSELTKNQLKIDPSTVTQNDYEADVLVIGGGVAGLFAAVKAHDAGAKVMLISKGGLGTSGQTPFAKGIFSFDPKSSKVTLDEFTDMVSRSALNTNNPIYTKQMAEHSQARVNELKQWGYFDEALCKKSFNKPILERNIVMKERVMVTHLIKENNKIVGAGGFNLDDAKIYMFRAKSIILCTGAGGFKPNGFPICDLTHDGTIMAYNIGAKVTGKEWNDGHLGSSTNPAACFNGWHGMFERTPSTTEAEVHHDLGVDLNYRVYMNGIPKKMDPHQISSPQAGGPYVPEEFNRHEGPPSGKEGSMPPGMNGNPSGGSSAGMSIHKSEGLVPINDKCTSTIPGLFAAGDALGSYMAGAIYTQIGSSMSGSAVQGAIAGEAAAIYCKTIAMPSVSSLQHEKIKAEILAPLKRTTGYSPAWVTQTLQGIMIPNSVLYIKKETMLTAALTYVEDLRDNYLPKLKAADMHELRLAHETGNMIISAEMKLKASLMRKESRCSHYRLDYPKLDNENWQAWINIYKDEKGEMQFEKQPFAQLPSSKS